ncbi:hypothetical protein Purlil1_8641 [Purpureocillium lilacinum]|uniref:Uncharacterized protein n=1 Tax=Purpureocillium lilacinum TaxID=33203 RepID=A0ABR0BSS0_PURLI|nr:hypothetical protein Purlil1_8641 [Purpureocillium lilacinum]
MDAGWVGGGLVTDDGGGLGVGRVTGGGEGRARGVLHGGWAVHELSLPAYWVGTYTQAPALDSRWATGTEFRAVYRHSRQVSLKFAGVAGMQWLPEALGSVRPQDGDPTLCTKQRGAQVPHGQLELSKQLHQTTACRQPWRRRRLVVAAAPAPAPAASDPMAHIPCTMGAKARGAARLERTGTGAGTGRDWALKGLASFSPVTPFDVRPSSGPYKPRQRRRSALREANHSPERATGKPFWLLTTASDRSGDATRRVTSPGWLRRRCPGEAKAALETVGLGFVLPCITGCPSVAQPA